MRRSILYPAGILGLTILLGGVASAFARLSILVPALFLVLGGIAALGLRRLALGQERLHSQLAEGQEELAAAQRRAGQDLAALKAAAKRNSVLQVERDAALDRVRRSGSLLMAVKDRVPNGICILDADATLADWNDDLCRLLDLSDGDLKHGRPAAEVLSGATQLGRDGRPGGPVDDWPGLLARLDRRPDVPRLSLRQPSGVSYEAELFPVAGGGALVSFMAAGVRSTGQGRRPALFDELTGLVSHGRFQDILTESVKSRRTGDTGFALLLLDLEALATVNQAFGSRAEDGVLTIVGDIISRHIREGDTAARLEGGQFAILFSGIGDVRVVMGRSEQLLQEIWQPMLIGDDQVQVNANIGIAMYPNQAIDPGSLMHLATTALDKARNNPRASVILADTVPHNVGTRPSTATKH